MDQNLDHAVGVGQKFGSEFGSVGDSNLDFWITTVGDGMRVELPPPFIYYKSLKQDGDPLNFKNYMLMTEHFQHFKTIVVLKFYMYVEVKKTYFYRLYLKKF